MVCFEISNNDDGIKLMINDFKDKNLCFANTNISNILIIYIYTITNLVLVKYFMCL